MPAQPSSPIPRRQRWPDEGPRRRPLLERLSEGHPRSAVRLGYGLAVLNALVSGVAIYVNSLGVAHFQNAVVYTSLKNGVSGILLLIPFALLSSQRRLYRGLRRRDWGWLVLLALTGGSVPFALYFTGLKMTSPVTGSLGSHLEFVVVALLAVAFLGERLGRSMWAGLAVLLAGVLLSTSLGLVRFNEGTVLIGASTVLFSVGFVVTKHLFQGRLSTMVAMTAQLTLGSAILFAYLATRGELAPIAHLDSLQWSYVVATGVILLLFTVTAFLAIRLIRVAAVTAIGTGAPIVTIAVDLIANRPLHLAGDEAGLVLTFVAVVAILVVGLREEGAAATLATGSAHPKGEGA